MADSALGQLRATWLTTAFSCALFLAVTYLLFWNEAQATVASRALERIRADVASVDAYAADADSRHDGRLVHVVGRVEIVEPLAEPDYNVQVLAVKLKKRVQMYQWIEERRGAGADDGFGNGLDDTPDVGSYSYYTDWRDYLVDSNLFYASPGHRNPKDMPLASETSIAENARIGRFALGVDVKRKFSDYYDITSDERPDRLDIKLHSGAYYHGADPLVHEVGDLRVIFSYAGRNGDWYSAIGVSDRSTIAPYASDASSEPLALLRKGRHSADEMIALEFRDANLATWRYRAVGWFQMFAAAMSLHPDWFSLLSSCRWASPRVRRRGRVFVNLALATCATLLIVAVARIFYSPWLSLGLIAAAIAPVVYFSSATQYVPVYRNVRPQ